MAGGRARRHVVSRVSAILQVNGPRQLLRAMRKRVVEGLSAEGDTLRMVQSHQDDQLEFRIECAGGLPYPVLVAASARYPDCVLTLDWETDSARGVTSIRNGEVQSANAGESTDMALAESIEMDAAGTLRLGLALPSASDSAAASVIGYAATSRAETYFRISGNADSCTLQTTGGDARAWNEDWTDSGGTWSCRASAEPQSISADDLRVLDDSAASFRARWLWYDHAALEETAIERQRAHDGARLVHPINVQSRGLARLAAGGSGQIAPHLQWVPALLARSWAAADL